MHPIELKIINFMKTVGKASVSVDDLVLKPAAKDLEYFLKKTYEDDPSRPFTMRLSNIGRPLCQLQMEQSKAPAVDDDWNFPLRMMYGSIIEALTVSILRHAGVSIEEEQTAVKLHVVYNTDEITRPEALPRFGMSRTCIINGTLDLVIDGKVWDIKSASQDAFKNKFASYESLKESDSFGYLPQLYGYSEARKLPPGGWIVIDKSAGIVKVLAVPDDYIGEQQQSLNKIAENVKILASNADFKRCFEDKAETFKKRQTGNTVLDYPCTFCKYKYACWPNLQFEPSVLSTAYDKPYRYYTNLVNRGL